MNYDNISEIEIRGESLYIRPARAKFPYIYREAMGAKWDAELNMLSMNEDMSWDGGLLKCFQQIIAAAKEQSCILMVTTDTKWTAVPDELKMQILELVSVNPLNNIVDLEVLDAVQVHDYYQLHFQNEWSLTINNAFSFFGKNSRFSDLKGLQITSFITDAKEVRLHFSNGVELKIGQDDASYSNSHEAMILSGPRAQIFVWN